jgi:hypothetical protein
MMARLTVGVVGFGAAWVLMGYPSQPPAPIASNSQPEVKIPEPARAAVIEPPEIRTAPPAAVARRVTTPRVPRTAVEESRQSLVTVVRNLPSVAVAAPQPAVASRTIAASEAPVSGGSSTSSPAEATTEGQTVTITGCLETTVEEDRFRLTDTEGSQAPKARSWRSGFLTRRSAPVELAQLSEGRVALRALVGHRVTATGLLEGRELRVRSLQGAGPSCN